MKTFKNDADFIEQLIQPVSAAQLQFDSVDVLKDEPVVIMTREDFESFKRVFESIKSLSVARRDQILSELKKEIA